MASVDHIDESITELQIQKAVVIAYVCRAFFSIEKAGLVHPTMANPMVKNNEGDLNAINRLKPTQHLMANFAMVKTGNALGIA